MINEIIALEWAQFDKVQNQDGRAGCQDDFETFNIMRSSQFMNWPEELLASYLQDLKDANAANRNLITEKYARMMESTTPEEYERIKQFFPELSPQRIALQELLIMGDVKWNEEFSAKYPKFASRSRAIHTSEDTIYSTSAETYLRGELSTYSDRTVALYGEWVQNLRGQGRNLVEMISETMAKLYGYTSVADAESKMK